MSRGRREFGADADAFSLSPEFADAGAGAIL
jgi:hypothetical protein